jgi:hypothetical protein
MGAAPCPIGDEQTPLLIADGADTSAHLHEHCCRDSSVEIPPAYGSSKSSRCFVSRSIHCRGLLSRSVVQRSWAWNSPLRPCR